MFFCAKITKLIKRIKNYYGLLFEQQICDRWKHEKKQAAIPYKSLDVEGGRLIKIAEINNDNVIGEKKKIKWTKKYYGNVFNWFDAIAFVAIIGHTHKK